MRYRYTIEQHTLKFRQPAGTSRGVYTERRIWLVKFEDTLTGRVGVGECAPLPNLSCDDLPNYEAVLNSLCDKVAHLGRTDFEDLRPYPSMTFGIETALLHAQRGTYRLFDTPYSRGEEQIPINGLIWMGTLDEMRKRVEEKIREGSRCIKIKIGAINWDDELSLIKSIRERYTEKEIEIRVDANGAFKTNEAIEKLERLAKYNLHSIEQPIEKGNWNEMARLCRTSPLPIALDEELIGINQPQEKAQLLDAIRPQYIVIKPSLHGGMQGSREWIELARERKIGSWLTSALESNVGLNAIANLAADIYGPNITFPQGLGTGKLFVENIKLNENE